MSGDTIVGTVLTVLIVASACWYGSWLYQHDPNILRFRRDLRNALHPKADPQVVAQLEHELGIEGHQIDCSSCQSKRARGEAVLGPGEFLIHPKAVKRASPFVPAVPDSTAFSRRLASEMARGVRLRTCHGRLDNEVWRAMECPHDL